MSNLKLVLMNIYDIFVVLLFNNPAIALVIMSILRHFIPQKRILWNIISTISAEPYMIPGSVFTVKILKYGTPQTIAIVVLKIEKFDVTLH